MNGCLVLWVLAMIPSIVTGLVAAEHFPAANQDLDVHKNLAFFTFCGAIFAVIVHILPYYSYPLMSQLYALFLTLLVFALLVLTGDIGGGIPRGGKNLFTNTHQDGEDGLTFYRRNPVSIRSFTPEQLKKHLIQSVGVEDVEDVMKRNNCSSCHQSQFEGGRLAHFSTQFGKSPMWLPRDKDNKLVDWSKSSFYHTVILLNRMPYDKERNPLGISPSDRLTLLYWLENGAPIESPHRSKGDAEEDEEESTENPDSVEDEEQK